MAEYDLVYLDTSALMRWASATAGSPYERDRRGHAKLEELIASSADLRGSPITVAEYTSVLYDYVRSDAEDARHFHAEDADRCMKQFMQWLADETIAINALGRRAFEMGMAYVGSVAQHGRKMRGWDAIHLYEACRWAREEDAPVVIATSDNDFRRTIELYPEFGRFVTALDTTAE